MFWPASGKVVAGSIVVEDSWGETLPKDAVFEGWTYVPSANAPDPGPMTVDEARDRLGPAVVAACTRRGVDIRKLDWNPWLESEFGPTEWYRAVRYLDPAHPWPLWLPLFARLLRAVETEPNEVWSRASDMVNAFNGELERRRSILGTTARLMAMLGLRLVEACLQSERIGPHHLVEIQSDVHGLVSSCVLYEERHERFGS